MSVFFFLLGAVFASFCCCMTDRCLSHESVMGHSRCPHCHHELAANDLIPVFSFLFLKGRCRYCHQRIDGWLPVCELAGGLTWMLLYRRYGLSLLLIRYLIFFTILQAISYCDLKSFQVPGSLLAVLLINRLVLYQTSDRPAAIILNAFYVPVFLLAFSLLFCLIRRKQPMGLGDIRLFWVLGCYFDWETVVVILFFSCLYGILFVLTGRKKERNQPFPFVPSIYLATLSALFWGRQIITFYLFRFTQLL